jgi:hypothetical protein
MYGPSGGGFPPPFNPGLPTQQLPQQPPPLQTQPYNPLPNTVPFNPGAQQQPPSGMGTPGGVPMHILQQLWQNNNPNVPMPSPYYGGALNYAPPSGAFAQSQAGQMGLIQFLLSQLGPFKAE